MTDTQNPQPIGKNVAPLTTAASVTLAGATVTIISFLFHQYGHVSLPDEVEKAILVLVDAAFAFMTHRLLIN